MTWSPDMPDRRQASDMVSWKSYVDRVFEEHRQQVQAAMTAHDERVETNRAAATERLMALSSHVEAMFGEKQRATEIAEREREKASTVLRDTERHATDVAEREREKSAQALVQTLSLSIQERGDRLREHIDNQSKQFADALDAIEGRAHLRHESIQSEFLLRQKASDAAVQKAEDAQRDINVRSNEFRGQLKDQNETMMPRLESESKHKEIRTLLDKLEDKMVATNTRIEQIVSNKAGSVEVRDQQQVSIGQMIGIVGLVIALVAIAFGAFT